MGAFQDIPRPRSSSSAFAQRKSTSLSTNAGNNFPKPGSGNRLTRFPNSKVGDHMQLSPSTMQRRDSGDAGSQITPHRGAPSGFGIKSTNGRQSSKSTPALLSEAQVAQPRLAGSPSRALLRQPRVQAS